MLAALWALLADWCLPDDALRSWGEPWWDYFEGGV